jgi:hypothetical protein
MGLYLHSYLMNVSHVVSEESTFPRFVRGFSYGESIEPTVTKDLDYNTIIKAIINTGTLLVLILYRWFPADCPLLHPSHCHHLGRQGFRSFQHIVRLSSLYNEGAYYLPVVNPADLRALSVVNSFSFY